MDPRGTVECAECVMIRQIGEPCGPLMPIFDDEQCEVGVEGPNAPGGGGQLVNKIGRERQLVLALEPVSHDYDYILIDCPPSLNMLTVNSLVAADGVVIPMQCEYYALEGLSSLLDTIEQIRINLNPDIRIEGLLRTMYDSRNNLSNDVSSELVEHFGNRVYRTVIPRNVSLAEAPSFGQSIINYDRNSRGSMAYLALAGEVLRRDAKQGALG